MAARAKTVQESFENSRDEKKLSGSFAYNLSQGLINGVAAVQKEQMEVEARGENWDDYCQTDFDESMKKIRQSR